jgi:thiol:disulfide interchange protein DsbA
MKTLPRSILLSLVSLIFITACGSASSDAKKVEIKKVANPAQAVTTASEKESSQDNKNEFEEGRHYVEIFPEMQTDSSPGKVEVIELMWLGCPHCYHLEPFINKYKKNHPDFVEFKQVPAMLNPSWAADANTFYIADMLDPTGEKDLVNRIFQSIHEQKRRLKNPSAVTRFFVQEGYTEEQVNSVKNSMAFQAKLKRAQEIGAAAQANSVPTLIINGKYRTSPYMAGGNEQVLKVVDMLTKQEKK